ncbi:hypothetical protein [Loigolactobacillus zhaoyuanensis]|uniref:Uncharacterized protein n=1 Tax=Loigolactobacillus zhaoyuanensis TaxID=2486017 RepID=A0ABW8UCJ4_9LACO|nr:hypothetical protein [Loigolactobacillus zhaoyuanensis]
MLFNKAMDYAVTGVYTVADQRKTERCVMHNATKREAKQQMLNYLTNKLSQSDGSYTDIVSINVTKPSTAESKK